MITWNTSSTGIAPDCASSHCSDAIGRRLWPLNSGRLCAAARLNTGLRNFGDPEIAARLGTLTDSLNADANLHAPGRFLASMHLGDLLKSRLLLENAWKRAQGMCDELIERPIFITGMPRSGSTFLQELLALDPGHRVPRVWEIMLPLGGLSTKQRIWRTGAYLWAFRQIAPRMDSVHPIRANTPHECIAIHSYTLLSREFVITFNVPRYEAFLDTVDFTPAYLWQKRFLQHLQWQHPPRRRWILKAPDHVYSLDALLRVFPDATIIQTHRNPLDVVNGASRLVDVLRRTFAWPEDQHQLRIREAEAVAEGVRRISRFRAEHPELADRFLDVNYDELIADPPGVVSRLYEQLNLPLVDTTMDLMRAFARDYDRNTGNPRRDFGFDPAVADGGFADYTTTLGILRPEQDA